MKAYKLIPVLFVTATLIAVAVEPVLAQPVAELSATTQSATTRDLVVAVLDFSTNAPGEPELGAQISEALIAMLSGEPGFRLVDRAALTRVLQEQELNLSGVVDTQQAVSVGRLVGARILVVGKAFAMGQQMLITAKLIGTETSLVDGVVVNGALDADIAALVVDLAGKIAVRLRAAGPRLVAQDDAGQDPLPALQKKLSGVQKPAVAVIVPERHMSHWAPLPDPAAETELKRLLRACGFTVQDVPQNELADFARNFKQTNPDAWPRQLAHADVVIVGEAFSEFAARIGNLVSCAARVEINVIDRRSGRVLLAQRDTARGVDLSENIAGKKALENAGRALGIQVLTYWAENLPLETDKVD